MYHKAWEENPPADWLVAAYLQYKAPSRSRREALENTRRMSDMLAAWDQLGAMKTPNQ